MNTPGTECFHVAGEPGGGTGTDPEARVVAAHTDASATQEKAPSPGQSPAVRQRQPRANESDPPRERPRGSFGHCLNCGYPLADLLGAGIPAARIGKVALIEKDPDFRCHCEYCGWSGTVVDLKEAAGRRRRPRKPSALAPASAPPLRSQPN